MLADEDPRPAAQRTREQENEQDYHRRRDKHGLRSRAPCTAEVADVVADEADYGQVDTGAEQGRRVEHDMARDEDADGPRR